jgi:outer membrane immunogenic protein
MKSTSLLAIVAASVMATQAYASGPVDIPVVIVEPPAPVSDWTGFYAGIHVGIGNAKDSIFLPLGGVDFNAVGLHAGYLSDMGSLVIGGEVSVDRIRTPFATGINFTHANIDAILGYDAGDIMPFVFIGADTLNSTILPTSQNGYSIGVGLTAKVTDNFSVTGKYRYTRFSNFVVGGNVATAGTLVLGGEYRF